MIRTVDNRQRWIERWREHRRTFQRSSAVEFIGQCPADNDVILELACLDLIESRRQKIDALVEHYIESRPELSRAESLLDLLDAEICVRQEMSEPLTPEVWAGRFPDYRRHIASLLTLEGDDQPSLAASSTNRYVGLRHAPDDPSSATIEGQGDIDRDAPSRSIFRTGDLSLDRFSFDGFSFDDAVQPNDPPDGKTIANRQRSSDDENVPGLPALDNPAWFIPQRMVASGPGHWTLKGYHADDNRVFALKVIEVPTTMGVSLGDLVIDNLASGATLGNETWVGCESASIRQRHLAVLRQWVEGQTWNRWVGSPMDRWRCLLKIVRGIASGHAMGVHHGGVHADNIFVDHDASAKLVDGGSSRGGIDRWVHADDGADSNRFYADIAGIVALLTQVDGPAILRRVGSGGNDWGRWQSYFHQVSTMSGHSPSQSRTPAESQRLDPTRSNVANTIADAMLMMMDGASSPPPLPNAENRPNIVSRVRRFFHE